MNPEIYEIMAIAASGAGFIVAIMLGRALARRIGGSRGSESVLTEELAALRHRVAALEEDVDRMGALEERVDFAERVMARAPREELPAPDTPITGG